MTVCLVVLTLTVSVSATSESTGGTIASAIESIGTALTGVIGYMSQTTAAILGDNLWLLGMGFFVLSFIIGLVLFLFKRGH